MEHKGPCTHKKCIWAIQKLISSNQTPKHYSHHGSRQPACLICGPLAVSQNQLPLPQPVCLSLNIFILSLTPVVDFLSPPVHKPDDWILWREEEVALYIQVAKELMKWLEKHNHRDVILFPLAEVWMQTWYLTLLRVPVDSSPSEPLLNRVILTFSVSSALTGYRNEVNL